MKERDFSVRARRTTRVAIRVPVRISVQDAFGSPEMFTAWTVVVNKHGARFDCKRAFRQNDEVSITNLANGKMAAGKVIWASGHADGEGNYEFAVELHKPVNLWSVSFPPQDWEDSPPPPENQLEIAVSSASSEFSPPEEQVQLENHESVSFTEQPAMESVSVQETKEQTEFVSESISELEIDASVFSWNEPEHSPAAAEVQAPAQETIPVEKNTAPVPAAVPPVQLVSEAQIRLDTRPAAPTGAGEPQRISLPSSNDMNHKLSPSTSDRLAEALRELVESTLRSKVDFESEHLVRNLRSDFQNAHDAAFRSFGKRTEAFLGEQISLLQKRAADAATQNRQAADEELQRIIKAGEQGASLVRQEIQAGISAALEDARKKIYSEVPALEEKFLQQCRVQTEQLLERLLSNMLETAKRDVFDRVDQRENEFEALVERAQQTLVQSAAQLEQASMRVLADSTARLEGQLAESAQKVLSSFAGPMLKQLDEQQKNLLEQTEARIKASSLEGAQDVRAGLASMLRELAQKIEAPPPASPGPGSLQAQDRNGRAKPLQERIAHPERFEPASYPHSIHEEEQAG